MGTTAIVLSLIALTEFSARLDKLREVLRRRKARRKHCYAIDEPGRSIAVVSTAAVPWMTGTAVNPTLRAAYLAHLTNLEVTLVVPWLAPCDQAKVFPNKLSFSDPAQQEACMREWVLKRTGLSPPFRVAFYAGRYDPYLLGILPVGDAQQALARLDADVVVLEEPEHLCWFHSGQQWTAAFPHVVGVMHTNYRELGRRNAGKAGLLVAGITHVLTYLLCGMHCHKVIKLSDTVQSLPRQVTEFVHGAAPGFLEEGARKAEPVQGDGKRFSKGAYCLGKVVWGKGWEELIKLLAHCKKTDSPCPTTHIDAFGDGEARVTIEREATRQGLPVRFFDKRDHLDPKLHDYQVFVNASTSDVVATTSIEALAMGKWLICADHPCNAFAAGFGNSLVYHDPSEFCTHLEYALTHEPAPLDAATLRDLSWDAATERFLHVANVAPKQWPHLATELAENLVWNIYRIFTGMELVRVLTCGGSNTRHTPHQVTDYDPSKSALSRSGSVSIMHTIGRLLCAVKPSAIYIKLSSYTIGIRRRDSLLLPMLNEQMLLE